MFLGHRAGGSGGPRGRNGDRLVAAAAQGIEDPGRAVDQLGEPPGGPALRGALPQEGAGGRESQRDRIVWSRAEAAVDAAEQQGHRLGVQGEQCDVSTQAGDVAAAVVERGEETAGQPGEIGVGTQFGVERPNPRTDVEPPAGAAAEHAGQHVADPLVGRAGQQAGIGQPGSQLAPDSGPQAAQLHVAPAGELQRAVAEVPRARTEREQLRGGERAAGHPDPGQCAIGGRVGLHRSGAGVHPGAGDGGSAGQRSVLSSRAGLAGQ